MQCHVAISYFRKRSKLSQQSFSTACGISIRALSNYEQGLRTPDVGSLLKIRNYAKRTEDMRSFDELSKCIDTLMGFKV